MKSKDDDETLNASNIKLFPELQALDDDQLAALISLLAIHDERLEIVKREFEELAEKKISLRAMNQVRQEYAEEIASRRKAHSRDISRIPIAREKVQLSKINKLLQYAMDPTQSRGYERCSKDDYEEKFGIDARLAKDLLLAAHKITMGLHVLELETKKFDRGGNTGGSSQGGAGQQSQMNGSESEEEDDDVKFGS